MNVLGREWRAVCAIICVCVQLTGARGISVYVINPRIHDDRAIGMGSIYGQIVNDSPNFMSKKLIPIKEPRPSRNFALPLEPDAEMLPAHYERVKPPGVDHMELKYAETQITKDTSKIEPSKGSDPSGDTKQLSEKQKSEAEKDKDEHQRTVSDQKEQANDDLVKKEKIEYVNVAGRKKIHDEGDNESQRHSEEGKSEEETSHGAKSKDKVDRVATGYRNVYHKDEYKKNHDFYDNDDHGGHSKQHGRYNERHVATEGTYKKGDSHRSNFGDGELQKQTEAEKSEGNEGVKDQGGFLKNYQEFTRQKQE